MNAWEEIKSRLSSRVTADAYNNWIAKAGFLHFDGSSLILQVPDAETKDWLEQAYAEEIRAAIREASLAVQRVVYQVDLPKPEGARAIGPLPHGSAPDPVFSAPTA